MLCSANCVRAGEKRQCVHISSRNTSFGTCFMTLSECVAQTLFRSMCEIYDSPQKYDETVVSCDASKKNEDFLPIHHSLSYVISCGLSESFLLISLLSRQLLVAYDIARDAIRRHFTFLGLWVRTLSTNRKTVFYCTNETPNMHKTSIVVVVVFHILCVSRAKDEKCAHSGW